MLREKKRKAARQQGGLSLGRIVPTEAKPSELSGEILSLTRKLVNAKTAAVQLPHSVPFTLPLQTAGESRYSPPVRFQARLF
jgi:hypothetical protein